ncbi:M66 family metalloprotease [Shewanella woodyi]|uniref:M66 family metalloprotease n=1 Tax=Shewanella woodyi TaxID=60961 RepID=UPI003748DB81
MKIKTLTLAISTLLMGMNSATSATSALPTSVEQMQQMQRQVQARINEVRALAKDPANLEVINGKTRLKYGDFLYDLSPDGNPMFFPFIAGNEYADKSATAMFDFVNGQWKLINEWDGIFIYHDQFGHNYLEENKQCNVRYLAGNDVDTLVSVATKNCQTYDNNASNTHGFIDDLDVVSHLSGDFQAQVRFIQNQTADAYGNDSKEQQRVVSQREALLVITPEHGHDPKMLELKISNNGELIDTIVMTPPQQILKSDRSVIDDREDVMYSKRSYTAVLPWHVMEKGLSLTIDTWEGTQGVLSEDQIEFGAPSHIEFPMIRIGMLTQPQSIKHLEQDTAHYTSQLFQRYPVASMTVRPYAPVYLDKVVMADGRVKENYSEYDAGVYASDMNNEIAASLITLGISNANYGLASSAPTVWYANYFPQIGIMHSIGRYKNSKGQIQDIAHGLLAGTGYVQLLDSIYNEATHEIGHALGLPDYNGGSENLTHHQNSGWGYDAYSGVMTDNLNWHNLVDGDYGYGGIMVKPFNDKYAYGSDPMGGGNFDSSTSVYPHFTSYGSKAMQHFLEQRNYLDLDFPTGYAHWDNDSQTMQGVADSTNPLPTKQAVDIITVVGYYDPMKENTSYIYPEMYSSHGNIFDYPAPTLGQCWATVTYANHATDVFGLIGHRQKLDWSNKLHINLARDRNPESVAVSCPEQDPRQIVHEQVLQESGQSRFFTWGDNNRQGTPGDVFEYHRGGDIEYYRLKTTSYWYFPESGQSNHQWQFMGYLTDFVNERFAHLSYDDFGIVEVDSRIFNTHPQEPAKAVTVGKDHGYRAAIDTRPELVDNQALSALDFTTVAEFDTWVADNYGSKVLNNGVTLASEKVGALYVNPNQVTGSRDYWLKKTIAMSAIPHSPQSNDDWKYLGSAAAFVNMSFNPITLDRSNSSVDDKILTYFAQEKLLNWDERTSTHWGLLENAVFASEPKGDETKQYFIQKRPGQGGAFPTDKQSNIDWHYLGDETSIEADIAELNSNQSLFEQRLLAWYKQEQIGQWGSDGQYGIVGDVYEYDFDGKIHYYRLKTGWYSYFPHPNQGAEASDKHWQYLGHF